MKFYLKQYQSFFSKLRYNSMAHFSGFIQNIDDLTVETVRAEFSYCDKTLKADPTAPSGNGVSPTAKRIWSKMASTEEEESTDSTKPKTEPKRDTRSKKNTPERN
jgi:hypothetical protein